MTPTERQELFTRIYRNNEWKGKQSRSGPGSDPEQIDVIKHGLEFIFRHLSIATITILDIPCGDFSLFRGSVLNNIRYIGADIVPELVEENNVSFHRSPKYRFLVKDILTDSLPEANVVVCRDCLPHFSYEDIWQALKNVCRTKASYLITTTFFTHQNTDIGTGGWRPLNLQAAPFNFPAPEICLSEQCTLTNGKFADKSLGVWRLENIRPCVYGELPK